jgi:hypothetical protein
MEKDLWRTMQLALKEYGHLQRIESMTGLGIPDVNYCFSSHEGWFENKYIPRWPARVDALVTVDHYTAQQRLWARQRIKAGGKVYMMLMVGTPRLYFLIPGDWAAQHLGIDATREQIVAASPVMGVGRFPTKELVQYLTTGLASRFA